MSVYLHDIPLEEAQVRLGEVLAEQEMAGVLGEETIGLDEAALGRVLTRPIFAKLSAPHYHASAMDGFAVIATATNNASLTAPIDLTCPDQAEWVDTGDPLPAWANAVIQVEHTEPISNDQLKINKNSDQSVDPRSPDAIRIRESIPPWKHVRAMGEDMVASELVLPSGHRIRPFDLGAIAGSGHHEITVAKQPRVAIIPTGSELKPIGDPVATGDIIEYNSVVLAAQVKEWGGIPTRWSIVPDTFDAIQKAVKAASQTHDLVLLNAGSSAGSEDFSASVVESLGRLLVHGVAVRPGHPVILGMLERDGWSVETPIIGVPGYPVSAAMTGEIFVKPLLDRWQGRQATPPQTLSATLTRKMVSPAGDDDYVRVVLGKINGKTLATPLARGAGVISSLVRADGLAIVPRGSQGLSAGSAVTVQLLRPKAAIDTTILAIGSHDMTLDLLAQAVSKRNRRLSSANIGSLGGLIALRRQEAHFAGTHLLDPQTGVYNQSYLAKYLPDQAIKLIGFVNREQGLLVAKGNPKNIQSLADLTRADIRFINRQNGAGTRVLLDYELGKAGVSPEEIGGYGQEEYTHLAVAAAIASGRADCGLGIAAAAEALGLDFVPLFTERYELAIPAEHLVSPLLAPLLECLQNDKFRTEVSGLRGYDPTIMGDKL